MFWYVNRENCAGFPSEYAGFEFKGKKKYYRSKQKEIKNTLINLKLGDSGFQTCSKTEVTLKRVS